MPSSRRPFMFVIVVAAGILTAKNCPADVMPTLPHNITISKMGDHGDLIFVLYADGDIEKGYLLDPKTAESAGQLQLPQQGLPVGKLSVLGVPRALVEKNNNKVDPAWLKDSTPGIVRVTGIIHHYPVQKSSARHQYQVDKTDDGLKITLLNPDVLTGYGPEPWMLEKSSPTSYLWWFILAGVIVLLAGAAAVWILMRRSPSVSPKP